MSKYRQADIFEKHHVMHSNSVLQIQSIIAVPGALLDTRETEMGHSFGREI